MKQEDLKFIGNNPGAVKYGNFINYYSFHSPHQRIENFNPNMFVKSIQDPVLALDIGCNSGELTAQFHTYLKKIFPNQECHILGIDIDPKLIKRANESFSNSEISFKAGDIMTSEIQSFIKQYREGHGKQTFDIVFCFSITMWIHLNSGDKGLTNFLELIKGISQTIVIEPQPWPCYRNAQRRVKKSGDDFPLYHTLEIRSNVTSYIQNILSSSGFTLIYDSLESKWHRKIQSYHLMKDK